MISLTVPNVITIGLIALVAVAAARWGARMTGIGADWL